MPYSHRLWLWGGGTVVFNSVSPIQLMPEGTGHIRLQLA